MSTSDSHRSHRGDELVCLASVLVCGQEQVDSQGKFAIREARQASLLAVGLGLVLPDPR
jgi:hypothetical protein